MAVPYYIGAKAIAARLGYRSTKTVMRLVERAGLPIFLRSVPVRTGKIRKYCISESALTAWELVQGQQNVNRIRAKRALEAEKRAHALTTQRMSIPHESASKPASSEASTDEH